jgi:hypothetical protein
MIRAQHLHTYFLIPFSIDKEAVVEDHPMFWNGGGNWLDGLDRWLAGAVHDTHRMVFDHVGAWKRHAYTDFDLDSRAYQDMAYFHRFVRRIFFDAIDPRAHAGEQESLLRCYVLPIPEGRTLQLQAEDDHGGKARVCVTGLQLFLFANGIGILSLAVEESDIPIPQALWINEMLRRLYPTSGRQVREGRVPCRVTLSILSEGKSTVLSSEDFRRGELIALAPPLSGIIRSLLYFLDYSRQEFEPVLDERAVVYTYVALDPATLPPNFHDSEEYQVLLSRLLYVELHGTEYRHDRVYIKDRLSKDLYRRWAHQGTWYGFTSYSSLTCALGTFDTDRHQLAEGFVVHRNFITRYYLMTLVALFYRVSLLDFSERTAMVSRRLYQDQQKGRISPDNIRLAMALRNEFLHFANYWYFEELANKDQESEQFARLSLAYRLDPMKAESDREIDKLNEASSEYLQRRNTEAVNRLALLSTILGAGAVVTGYFGMNFGKGFGRLLFEPGAGDPEVLHHGGILLATVFGVCALGLCVYLLVANWSDYRGSLRPQSRKSPSQPGMSLKRGRVAEDS